MGVFYFQAEAGIRDIGVTGVQTCALPISMQLTERITGITTLLFLTSKWVFLCPAIEGRETGPTV